MAGERELPATIRIGAIDRLTKTMDKIKNKFPELTRSVSRTNTMFGLLHKTTEKYREALDRVGERFKKVGETMSLAITAPVAAAAAYSIKQFTDIEDALADVKVHTHLSGEELKTFGQHIAHISTVIPESQEDLLKLASAAGEAGVRGSENIEKFSVTLAKLGKVAGINGEEAAESIAKVLELTGEGPEKVENFGSALVALSDKFGVSGKNVLENATSINREIARFGVSSAQSLALATAIEPLGFNAKAAGITVTEAFGGINEAVIKGGQHLKALEIITGKSGDELKKQFKEDSPAVFREFLTGLQKVQANGGSAADALKFFGVTGDKADVMLTTLAKNGGKLDEIFKVAGDTFKSNTALTGAYEDRTATFDSKMKLLHNTTQALAQQLGEKLTPFVSEFITILTNGMRFLDSHPTFATMVAVFAGLAAVVGPVLLTIGGFITTIPKLIAGWEALTAVYAGFTAVEWAAYAPLLLTIGAYALIAAGIIALIVIIYKFRVAIYEGIVTAFTYWEEKIISVFTWMQHLLGAVGKFFGLGGKKLDIGIETPDGQTKDLLAPSGPDLGGAKAASSMNPDFSVQTNNARVDINVNAPQSTRVTSESEGNFTSINRGLAGAF